MSRPIIGLLLNYLDAPRSIRCIQSLLDQGISRVLVWDNSADGGESAMLIREVLGEEARLDIHLSEVNLGFAAGVNAGLRRCIGIDPQAHVLLINNDARLLSGGLSLLADALHNASGAVLAYPNINHAGRILGTSYCHRLTGLLSWNARPGCFAYASGCCLLIALDRVALPLFDEDFFMYGEDCELGWRLSRRPGAVVHVDKTLVDHDGGASSGLGSMFYETSMVTGHLLLARKLGRSPIDRWLLFASRGIMLVLRAAVRSWRFRSLTPWIALVRGAGQAWAVR